MGAVLDIDPRPILIVDDDAECCAALARLLDRHGFVVDTVASASSALARCGEDMPALVILELMLPHMDGEQFLERYLERWSDTAAPVLLLSASATRETVAARLGLAGSLPKPFDADELVKLVGDIMRFVSPPPTSP